MNISLIFKGQTHNIEAEATDSIRDLQKKISDLINLPEKHQKLIYKGKSITNSDSNKSLKDYDIIADSKIMLIGTTSEQVEKVVEISSREKYPLKPLKAYSDSTDDAKYSFQNYQVLSAYSDNSKAMELLKKLGTDYGIKMIMKKYKWTVNLLKELDPDEKTILGYNKNKGQEIALRLRTDESSLDKKGFRHFPSIKKVLLHELTHMVHSEHDAKFYELNRELNKEDPVERKLTSSSPYASNVESKPAQSYQGGTFKLGGNIQPVDLEDKEKRREFLNRIMDLRLTKEEQDIEQGCKK